MADFLVTWVIDIDDVDDERQAAQAALAIMRDPGSEALHFRVREHGRRFVAIDLGVDETPADQLRQSTRRKK